MHKRLYSFRTTKSLPPTQYFATQNEKLSTKVARTQQWVFTISVHKSWLLSSFHWLSFDFATVQSEARKDSTAPHASFELIQTTAVAMGWSSFVKITGLLESFLLMPLNFLVVGLINDCRAGQRALFANFLGVVRMLFTTSWSRDFKHTC